MSKELELLNRRFEREKNARIEAEKLLEGKSLELYNSNLELKSFNDKLEKLVQERTEKLTTSEALYQSLVNSISDLICKTKLNGEITFVNPVTAKTLGYEIEEIIGQNIFDFISPKYRKKAFKFISKQFFNRNCISYKEYPLLTKNGVEIWLGNNIQFFEKKCLTCDKKQCKLAGLTKKISSTECFYDEIIIVARDITAKKQSEELNKKQSKQLELFLNHQLIISEIALDLNLVGDFDTKMNSAVETIGEHLNVSRVYIFENSKDIELTSNVYEWCNHNIIPQLNDLQNISYKTIPSWKKILTKEGIIFSEDIHELPPDIRNILEPQNIKSIVVLPLNISNTFFGFIGFDECTLIRKWEIAEIELLKTISNIVSNAYERKIIEQNLIKSEHENRAIIDSIPDFIFINDKNNRVKSFKQSTFTPANYAPDYYIGKKMSELFKKDFANQIEVALAECRKNGQFQYNYQHTIKGILRDFEARMSMMNDEDIISIVRDVSEIKENEKQLKIAKENAENASRSKSEFLANVSHEIRTPMNAILGFSEILIDKIDNPQYQNKLKTILSSGRTLLSLINDILDLSKIESGKLDIEIEVMQFNTVIFEIENIFTQKTTKKQLTFEAIVHPNIPQFIYMDEVRFHQILFNIVGNAVKFTEKGYVKIECFSKPSAKEGCVNLFIDIIDTGIGIPDDQQEKIFEAFTQQSGQSSRKYGGTGLGLAISKRLIEKLNGTLKISSILGKGTTFHILFNDVQEAAKPTSSAIVGDQTEKNIRFKKATILIVDDIDYNIQVLKNLIDYESFSFIEASSAEQALDILENETPDLIFMDIRMQGMSGLSATEIIKDTPRLKHIPVIAFTASAMQNQIEKIESLFDGYLRKPASRKQIIQALKQHLTYSYIEDDIELNKIKALDEINQECLPYIPKLLEILQNKLFEKWNEISGSFVIYEIEAFCDELEKINVEYSCNLIRSYTESLRESIHSFDVEQIEETLKNYVNIIDKLKTHLK